MSARAGASHGRRLAALALLLGAAAIVVGDPAGLRPISFSPVPESTIAGTEVRLLDPLSLGEWIMAKRSDILLLDLRPEAEFDAYHIPFAKNVPPHRLAGIEPDRGQMLVAYLGDDTYSQELPGKLQLLGFAKVYMLRGGLQAWAERVLFPDLTRADEDSRDLVEQVAKMSHYFGGKPRLDRGRGKTPSRFLREGC